MNIIIIDYGMGNIYSIIGALEYLGINNIKVTSSYKDIKNADKLILPGVGSFKKAIDTLKEKNLDEVIVEEVNIKNKNIMGICLGMQLLCSSSTENGLSKGLELVDAKVEKFDTNLKIPHVGFNQVKANKDSKLYQNMNDINDFYFTHSFRVMSEENINQSTCDYGEKFIASFEKENIYGVQFHPELSQKNGLTLLKNFMSI